jgi:LytS/YehU family sensor histidine kinase
MVNRVFGGYMMYFIFVVFFYAVNYYQSFKEKLKNEGKLLSLVKEAELHALKSQINPHFLFNSLNSISSLTMTEPERAQEMVINLSQLMRYSLKHEQDDKVTFKQELDNNKLYLSIEKVRFGKKLNPVFAIEEDCLKAEIPNMILQPLYENVIKHAVHEAESIIKVHTKINTDDDFMRICISNNIEKGTVSAKGEGIGLQNIMQRLNRIYGNKQDFIIKKTEDNFKVVFLIPKTKHND